MSTKEEKPGDEKEPESTWKHSIYNPRTGEFFGRTASSWGLILLFYTVFYGFLTGMFSLTLWVMLQTLDENVPKYNDRVSSPGLVIIPKSMEIVYNKSEPLQYRQFIQHLETLLQKYNDSEQVENEMCLSGQYYEQEGEAQKKACQFRRSFLGRCSGLADPTFGYAQGQPCVLIKMNRVSHSDSGCSSLVLRTTKVLKTTLAIGLFVLSPFLQSGYVQPLVAMNLLLSKENYNQDITVECRVEGSNLKNNDDRDKFLGRVTFRLLVTE
uniref:Sodium/potassium-transporting ATPase subunit beta n=1 Tax=Electrophorus electricus TaxID=8005 RepID=A0A4W4G6W9_ELEEL